MSTLTSKESKEKSLASMLKHVKEKSIDPILISELNPSNIANLHGIPVKIFDTLTKKGVIKTWKKGRTAYYQWNTIEPSLKMASAIWDIYQNPDKSKAKIAETPITSKWTTGELSFVEKNFMMGPDWVAKELNRKQGDVKKQIEKIKRSKLGQKDTAYTDLKIYRTKQYDRFSFIKGNRHVIDKKVDKLIESIKGGLNILQYAPILVDKYYMIIDGQHRFCASKELGEYVYYVKVDDFSIQEIAEINSRSDKWKSKDFLECYKNLGITDYVVLDKFIQKYKVGYSVAVILLQSGKVGSGGGGRKKGSSKSDMELFNDGLFKVNHLEFAEKVGKYIVDFREFFSKSHQRQFVLAITKLLYSELYDHTYMMDRLKRANRKIEPAATAKEYLAQLEEIYNYKSKSRKRIY